MIAPETGAAASARELLDRWAESLAEVFESMAEERPKVQWRPEPATSAPPDGAVLWWEQPFQLGPDAAVWVGAPQETWEYAGAKMLRAAGVETIEAAEARSTWLEILGQSLSGMARTIGGIVGRETPCDPGLERQPGATSLENASVSLQFADGANQPLMVAFSSRLLEQVSSAPGARTGRILFHKRRTNPPKSERKPMRPAMPAPWPSPAPGISCSTLSFRSASRLEEPSSP
jgi:hypothetical protein